MKRAITRLVFHSFVYRHYPLTAPTLLMHRGKTYHTQLVRVTYTEDRDCQERRESPQESTISVSDHSTLSLWSQDINLLEGNKPSLPHMYSLSLIHDIMMNIFES